MAAGTIVGALGGAGYRRTRPRRQVADLIGSRRDSFTAAELMSEARRRGIRIGRATVFRALDTFAELGVLERLELAEGEHAYVTCEPHDEHHHHVICRRCGTAGEVTGCDIGRWARLVEERTGYAITTHRTELFGLCPACRGTGAPR